MIRAFCAFQKQQQQHKDWREKCICALRYAISSHFIKCLDSYRIIKRLSFCHIIIINWFIANSFTSDGRKNWFVRCSVLCIFVQTNKNLLKKKRGFDNIRCLTNYYTHKHLYGKTFNKEPRESLEQTSETKSFGFFLLKNNPKWLKGRVFISVHVPHFHTIISGYHHTQTIQIHSNSQAVGDVIIVIHHQIIMNLLKP